jgi:hypothetical protein
MLLRFARFIWPTLVYYPNIPALTAWILMVPVWYVVLLWLCGLTWFSALVGAVIIAHLVYFFVWDIFANEPADPQDFWRVTKDVAYEWRVAFAMIAVTGAILYAAYRFLW